MIKKIIFSTLFLSASIAHSMNKINEGIEISINTSHQPSKLNPSPENVKYYRQDNAGTIFVDLILSTICPTPRTIKKKVSQLLSCVPFCSKTAMFIKEKEE
ncbi:hypothetical protein KAH94_06130 [bacterium]|nr:hypothetical protein [bacterium]